MNRMQLQVLLYVLKRLLCPMNVHSMFFSASKFVVHKVQPIGPRDINYHHSITSIPWDIN